MSEVAHDLRDVSGESTFTEIWGTPPPTPPSVDAQIARAGSRAEAARWAAISSATERSIAVESMASLPVPTGSETYAFMLCLYGADVSAQDYVLYEPELAVWVNAETLEVQDSTRWREPVNREHDSPITYAQPPAAHALPSTVRDELQYELLLLYDDVTPLLGREKLSDEERQTVARFDYLFRFLVPSALFPYYERLSPEFFGWLARACGEANQVSLVERGQTTVPPEARGDLDVPGRYLPELYEAQALLHELPPGGAWRLSAGALAAALQDTGSSPAPHSPLAGLSAAPDSAALAEAVTPGERWPADDWRLALRTLCRPSWEIRRLMGEGAFSTQATVYVGPPDGDIMWVRYERDDDSHVVSFPDAPSHFKDAVVTRLRAREVVETEPDNWSFTPRELALVFAGADLWSQVAAQREPSEVNLASLANVRRTSVISEATDLTWSGIGLAISPLPLPPEEAPLEQAVHSLVSRGQLQEREQVLNLGTELRALVRSLGRPEAFCGVQVREFMDDEGSAVMGLAIVRAGDRLWCWELAEDTPAGLPEVEAPVQLFQITGEQLRTILDRLLGPDEVPDEMPDEAPDSDLPGV